MSSHTDSTTAAVWLLPYSCDPIEYLSKKIIQQFNDQLPDLTHVTILMPDSQATTRLRCSISNEALSAGFPALLGLEIQSLAQFIDNTSIETPLEVIPKATRELMLVEALREYPHLYGKSSPWLLAEDLLQLFDELSQQQMPLPNTLEQFNAALQTAYSVPESEFANIEIQLSQEAKLVHTLWQAWQQQLSEENSIDQSSLYIEKLEKFVPINDKQHIFLLGYTRFSTAEQQWFNKLAANGQASLFIQGKQTYNEEHYQPDLAIAKLLEDNARHLELVEEENNDYENVINDLYHHHTSNISTRAKRMAKKYPTSPLQERISFLAATDTEQEALGIELQIRQWLHEGKEDIGVVTQDRRLARRLRALLERTGIHLRDYSGWALSTTSAAAALERWLECIEQDFNHLPLLDLLKSSFVFGSIEKKDFLYSIYRLEQDIILHENIASGLYRYQRQIDRRATLIDEIWTQTIVDDIKTFLDHLAEAAKPLQRLQKGKHQPIEFLNALLTSMTHIEMLPSFSIDEAGQRVLDELNVMQLSLKNREFSISWSEFRSWLGRTLERYNFTPTINASPVHLLDLNSSLLSHFDALIVAAADAEHLPGRPAVAAFFNDAVRYSLQLQTSEQHSVSMYYRYRCLLHAAPIILFTYTANNDGNANLASPWLECMQHYQHIAWNNYLDNTHLQQWLLNYDGHSQSGDNQTATLTHEYPRVACDIDLLPLKISASSYQQLINCPYQFFAARCLGLQATDEIRLVLEKNDYGKRIHRCLQAFHSDINDLPGPFAEDITIGNRHHAIECLEEISETIFSRDVEDNFQHRGWLQAWQKLIPKYITWQMKHQEHWEVTKTEKTSDDKELKGLKLNGILDRVDSGENGLGIIDYKTGATPTQKDIDSGEAVQLPFYALLLGKIVQRVEYLSLSDDLRTKGNLEEPELQDLVQAQAERLTEVFSQLQHGGALPAWGNAKTCSYCDMKGLCRRDAWQLDIEMAQ